MYTMLPFCAYQQKSFLLNKVKKNIVKRFVRSKISSLAAIGLCEYREYFTGYEKQNFKRFFVILFILSIQIYFIKFILFVLFIVTLIKLK